MLLILLLFPLFIMIFMLKYQKVLTEPQFAQKWDTLYQGIDTAQLSSLLYNAVFCIRRFNIVLVNMVFSPGFPMTNFQQHHYLFKNFLFIFIQTLYVMYIADSRPHSLSIFNLLEFFNEGMITLMCYIMLCFTGIGPSNMIMQSKTPMYLSLAVTVSIVIANFSVLIKMTYRKIKQRKAQKLREKRERTIKNLERRIKKKRRD